MRRMADTRLIYFKMYVQRLNSFYYEMNKIMCVNERKKETHVIHFDYFAGVQQKLLTVCVYVGLKSRCCCTIDVTLCLLVLLAMFIR